MVRGEPRAEYESALDSLDSDVQDGKVSKADADAIQELAAAFDREDKQVSKPTDIYEKRATKFKEYSTLTGWVERLRLIAHHVELTAEETTADDINRFTTARKKDTKDNGEQFSTSHVRNLEHAARKFYRYHGLGVDVDAIAVHNYDSNGGNGWDARDLLDAGERTRLRSVADHPRDRAILHLLLYTGMRNTALRTLRIRDIELDDHEWYFNTSADGLKNIHRADEPRPLFQAERAVRDWLDHHPNPEPDNYLITGKSGSPNNDPTEQVTRETIRRVMERLKGRTHCPDCWGDGKIDCYRCTKDGMDGDEPCDRCDGVGYLPCDRCNGSGDSDNMEPVQKPCHPHMLRHNFVSMCRKHPEITDADIKFYIGHSPDSDVMETTYSHLSSDDHNERGKSAFGTADAGNDGDDVPPWDTTCNECGRVLAPGDDMCEGCGTERGSTPWDDIPDGDTDPVEVGPEFEAMAEVMSNPDEFEEMIEEKIEEMFEDEPSALNGE